MYLRILANGKYKITAPMDGNECPVYKELCNELPPQYRRNGHALLNKLKIISEKGCGIFSTEIIHEISKKHKIYEIVQGDLRLIFFHGKKEMVAICTEVFIKKTQKTKPAVVDRAVDARRTYLEAIKKNNLTIVEEN